MALINWTDVANRYNELAKLEASLPTSSWLTYSIAELESRLSPRFTVPFSSNNLTAKDLAIDMTMAKYWRFKDPEKAASVDSYVGGRIESLLRGDINMMLSDGTTLDADVGELIWSESKNKVPVFGVSPTEFSQVDSSIINAEETARGRY